jgi:hypothetical protein
VISFWKNDCLLSAVPEVCFGKTGFRQEGSQGGFETRPYGVVDLS